MKTLLHILDWCFPWTSHKINGIRFGILAAVWGWVAADSDGAAKDKLIE